MEEMKRNPRPAGLRTAPTPIAPTSTEAVDEKQKNEFFSFHIGETSFHAGDANSKLSINLGGLDVDYNATTTEEKKKKSSVEEELASKIGAVFETLKNITPTPSPATPTPSPATPSTPNATPAPIPTPSWNPWAYRPRPTCSQPVSGSDPKPISPKVESVEKNVAPDYTNNENKPTESITPTPEHTTSKPESMTITREEYKRLLNSIYGMMEAIEQLKRAVEKNLIK